METVTLFGEEIGLDKEMYIFLDMAAIVEAEVDKPQLKKKLIKF